MPANPDWNDLHWILALAETGSLSATARRLGVSQSTMSRRMRALSDRGIRAFDAGTRPTALGERLIAAARIMQAGHETALAALVAAPRPLRIAACEVTARGALAAALPGWSGTPVELVVHDDLFALPASGYDILVTPLDSLPEGHDGMQVDEIHWGFYASQDYLATHPLRAGANRLDGQRVIHAAGSIADVAAYRWLERQGGTVSLLASSPAAQAEAAARGQGIALLPEITVAADTRLVRLPLAACVPAPVWMVAPPSAASQPRIAEFLRWARRALREAG